MTTARFAFWTGVFFLAYGVAGFIPPFVSYPTAGNDALLFPSAFGDVFGLFPSNSIHDLVHMGIGIWGLIAASSIMASIVFLRAMSVFLAVATVMGMIPGLTTFFGLMPVYGGNVWLNALAAIATGYFGFVRTRKDRVVSRDFDIRKAA